MCYRSWFLIIDSVTWLDSCFFYKDLKGFYIQFYWTYRYSKSSCFLLCFFFLKVVFEIKNEKIQSNPIQSSLFFLFFFAIITVTPKNERLIIALLSWFTFSLDIWISPMSKLKPCLQPWRGLLWITTQLEINPHKM